MHVQPPKGSSRWLMALCLVVTTLAGCGGEDFTRESLGTSIEPTDPSNRISPSVEMQEAPDYTGSNALVIDAQERFRTALDLHRKVIWRTCTPNDGVCHNQKEYPDLHTPANFLSAINAPCNVTPGEWESASDNCERVGDRLEFNGDRIEIGYIDYVVGEYEEGATPRDLFDADGTLPNAMTPGLHIYLRNPVRVDNDRKQVFTTASFVRDFRNTNPDGQVVIDELPFASFRSRWWIIDEGTHIMAEVSEFQTDQINNLLNVGVVQGDLNRNGIFGQAEGRTVAMLQPSAPESSYLIARLRGVIRDPATGMDTEIPGSRMPLANPPLSIPEMLALFCFVEQLPNVEKIDENLNWEIDYANCSYSADPENLNLLGEGVTWIGRISKILESNCGGCHGGTREEGGLNLQNDMAYEALLENSKQLPEMQLVVPGDPENSYLVWKLENRDGIVGTPMPLNPLTGEGALSQAEIEDIKTWIANGALKEE